MKNRSRKTILNELQADAGNTPVKGSDIERSKTRLSREEIISGLRSMAQGGEATRSAINDAYQARTVQRQNLRAERYNNLVTDYQALFDENKMLRTEKADIKTVAGLLSRAEELYKERTSETESSLKALQESLRSIQARNQIQNMVSAVIPDSWERAIEQAKKREGESQERPEQMSRWAQMEKNAYAQKQREAQRALDSVQKQIDEIENDERAGAYHPEYQNLLKQRDELKNAISKYGDQQKSAEEKRGQIQQYQEQVSAAEVQSKIAENPANFMRWARMEANAYQKKLDETEYDWTDNQSREEYNALNQQWHEKIDAANALHDYAQAAMIEQEAAAYTGEIIAPENPGQLYRRINGDLKLAHNQDADIPEAFLSETQRSTFNYLAGVKGEDAAEAYYELIKPQLEAARSANTAEEWEAITKEHPYLATVSSVLMTPLKIPAGLASVAKASFGADINQNDAMHQVVHAQNAIRQTAPEVTNWTGNATIFGQDADTFLYGTITSALDSALNMAIAGAVTGAAGAAVGGFNAEQTASITSNLVSALMGAEMLPDTIMQEKAKGRRDSEAVALGIIRSTVEGITEKYSVEAFLGDPRGVAKRLEKAFVAEGSEEVASNWLNRIVDIAVKDPDNLKAQYDRLKESGASSGDALTQVIFGAMEEDAGSFLAGGISGLAMGAVSELTTYRQQHSEQIQKEETPAAAEQDLDAKAEALYQEFGSTSVQPKTAEQTVEERADALYREFSGKAGAVSEPQNALSGAQETVQTPRKTEQKTGAAYQTARNTGKPAAQQPARRTVTTGTGGTAIRGTDVVKVVRVGDYDMEVQRTDGKRVSLNTVDQRGTALEVMQFAKEMPDYRDIMTVNGMMKDYDMYLDGSRGNRSLAERFFDNYVIALTGGVEGESLEDVQGITTDRKMKNALENAWIRGVQIDKGRRISMEMGSAGRATMEQYGYLYPQMFSDFYRAGQHGATFQQAMDAAGVKSLGEIKKAEMKAAWKAGRKDGTDYEVERYAVSDAGSQRENGLGSGGKAGNLEERTGGSEGREGGRVGRRGGGNAENRTSLKALGVRSGTDAPQNVVSREKNEYGGEIITVSDRLLVLGQDGMEREVQGIQSGNNVILRADDPMMEQHKAHELEHIRQRSMTDGEITTVFREKTKSLSDKNLRRILSAYALDYYGLYGADDTTMADLYREYLADEAAGIRHKETDQDVILPDERGSNRDQRDGIRAMRGNQNEEKPAYAVNREYAAELDAWVRDGMSEGERFELGSTGPVLQGLGAIESDIYINGDKIKTILQIHPEMTIAEIKKIPEILEDPALVLKSRTKGNSIVVFGTYRAQNGKPILAAMDLRPMEKGFVLTDMQKVASAYTKTETRNKTAEENGRDFLQSSDVLFLDKKRAALVLRPMGIYAPMDILRSGYIGSISYSGRYVNTEGVPFSSVVREQGESYSISAPERDSTGRELSTEQAEYFKGSKVRDEDGNLKPVYHGSGAKFTEFSHKFGGSNGSAEGQGFYFTDYKPMAEGYEKKGGQLLEGYLDIKKPLSDSELTLRRNEVMKLVKAIDPTGDDLVINYDPSGMGYPSSAWYNRALRETVNMLMQNETDSELMGEIANAFGDREPVLKAAREQLGYDGYIVDGKYAGATVYVAFDSSQFKNLDNYTPTENRDIRYSVSEEYEPVSSAEYAKMQRERKRQEALMEQSTKQTFELRRQFTEGTERNLSANDLPGIAADLRRIYGKKTMGQAELQERLEHIATVKARERSPMEAYRRAKDEADILAADMIRNALGQTDEAKDDWNGIKAAFRSGGKPVKLFIDGANRMDLEAEGGYEGMRKRLMGYAFLSSGGVPVDVFYQEELSSRFPGYFPASIQNPADQLIRIVKVIDQFRAIFRSPYAGSMAEDTEMLSQDILQRLYNSMTPSGNEAAFAEQHEDMVRAYYETKLQSTRDAWKNQVEQMKQGFADKQQEQRTEREKRKMQEQLLKQMQRAKRIRPGAFGYEKAVELIGNLDTISIKMTGKTIIGDYIGNTSTEGIPIAGTTKKGQPMVNLTDLKEWIDQMKANNPDFNPDRRTMEKVDRLMRTQISDLTITELRELIEVFQNLENEIATHNKLIKSEDKREIAVLSAEVRADIEEAGGVAERRLAEWMSDYITTQSLSPIRFVRRITGYKDNNPLYRAALELQRGETAMLDYQRRAAERFRSFQENKSFMESLSGKKSKAIEITGRTKDGIQTVKITPDMRIAIYLHSKNNSNVRHAELGGMMIPDYDRLMRGDKRAYSKGTVMYLTRSQMQAIAQGMTVQERNYADAIWEYYNAFANEEINAVSRDLLGFDVATVRNYYPIEANKNYTRGDPSAVKHDAKIESAGFLKERIEAGNTMNLRGATETLERAIAQNAKYVGLAIPVRNFGKLYGNTAWEISPIEEDSRGIQTTATSTAAILERMYGEEAKKYIDKLMADIQMPSHIQDIYGKKLDKIRSNYAGAVLTLNLSVAMKQAASYPTAAAVVGWKPLAQAMTNWKTADLDRIAKYTPLLWYRSKGYSTKELGDLAKGNKSLPWFLNWVQGIDIATTKKLWKAAEYYIRDNQKELTIGSEDYYKAVAEVYNRIILETQPNYTTMERPQALRSDSDIAKNMMMFKTQPMQNLNIAYDAITNLRAKERQLKAARDAARNDPAASEWVKEAERAVKQAKTDFGNSISALLTSAIVFAGMTLAWNALRGKTSKYKDDDDEWTVKTFLAGFGGDVLSNFAGMVPFGSDVFNAVWSWLTGSTYYGIETVAASSITELVKNLIKIPDNFADVVAAVKGDKPVGDVVWSVNDLITSLTKLITVKGFSAPAENIENIAKMLFLNVLRGNAKLGNMTAEEADYWYRYYTTKTTASNRRSQDYADIYESAKAGNMDSYQEMRDKMENWIWKENDSYQSGEISRDEAIEKAKETVNKAMQDRIKDEFLDGTLKEDKARKLLTEIGGLDADKAEESLQKWMFKEESGNSDASASRAAKYYEFAEPAGINISVFDEAYTFASNVEADKDENGEPISGSAKQKVVDYVLGLGLSSEQERALWNAVKGNWSDKDTPWQ